MQGRFLEACQQLSLPCGPLQAGRARERRRFGAGGAGVVVSRQPSGPGARVSRQHSGPGARGRRHTQNPQVQGPRAREAYLVDRAWPLPHAGERRRERRGPEGTLTGGRAEQRGAEDGPARARPSGAPSARAESLVQPYPWDALPTLMPWLRAPRQSSEHMLRHTAPATPPHTPKLKAPRLHPHLLGCHARRVLPTPLNDSNPPLSLSAFLQCEAIWARAGRSIKAAC